MNFSPSFGVLTLQYVPAVPQLDAKDRLSDDARVVSNRRRYLLEVDLRISNHSERPFCAPNLTFVPPIQHFQARRGGPTQGEFPERPFAWGPGQASSATRRHGRTDMNKSSWQKPASLHTATATKSIGALIGEALGTPDVGARPMMTPVSLAAPLR